MVVIHLYDLLQQKGWTQRYLSEETGIRETTISNLCHNVTKEIRIDYIDELCRVLNCPVGKIFEYIPDEEF